MDSMLPASRALYWRTVATVLWLPLRRYPWALAFLTLLIAAGWSLPVFIDKPKVVYGSLGAHAYATMFIAMLSAMVWTSVCRPETQMLPGFRRALASVWGLYGLFLVLLPAAIAHAYVDAGVLTAAGLMLVVATSMATGSGVKWTIFVWLAPMLLGIWPEFAKEVWLALTTSTLAPLLLVALAAVIMRVVWRRLMTISDAAPTLSPADINASDMSAAADAARIKQAGGLALWLQKAQHRLSARAFDVTLGALRRRRSGADRRIIEMVLMPNNHWRGMALELTVTVLGVGLLVAMIGLQRGGPPPIGMAASYIGMLTALRFQQLHRASLMLRPSLVDVYLAAAPKSQLDFTIEVANALSAALIPATLFALALLGLVGLMYPVENRLPLLLGGAAGAFAGSLASLGVVLMLLDSERPRLILGLLVLSFFGALPTSLCVAAALRSPTAGALVAAIALIGAYGFYARARDYATRWPIRFEAPL